MYSVATSYLKTESFLSLVTNGIKMRGLEANRNKPSFEKIYFEFLLQFFNLYKLYKSQKKTSQFSKNLVISPVERKSHLKTSLERLETKEFPQLKTDQNVTYTPSSIVSTHSFEHGSASARVVESNGRTNLCFIFWKLYRVSRNSCLKILKHNTKNPRYNQEPK